MLQALQHTAQHSTSVHCSLSSSTMQCAARAIASPSRVSSSLANYKRARARCSAQLLVRLVDTPIRSPITTRDSGGERDATARSSPQHDSSTAQRSATQRKAKAMRRDARSGPVRDTTWRRLRASQSVDDSYEEMSQLASRQYCTVIQGLALDSRHPSRLAVGGCASRVPTSRVASRFVPDGDAMTKRRTRALIVRAKENTSASALPDMLWDRVPADPYASFRILFIRALFDREKRKRCDLRIICICYWDITTA